MAVTLDSTNPARFGATLDDNGCHFKLHAPRASHVELVLIHPSRPPRTEAMLMDAGGSWSTYVPGVQAGQRYGYRVHGDWDPDSGLRFNSAKLLLDPYARAITSGIDYFGPVLDHVPASYYVPDRRDSAESVPIGVVVADSAPPLPHPGRRAMTDSVIYELHVKGFTQLHPDIPPHLRGTFAGLAHPAVIEYLTSLGVSAIELLPAQHFISEKFVFFNGKTNYWGYNTLGFFAPHAAYCSTGSMGQQVDEFKNMVSVMHSAGIEVLMDVVYNHTAEASLAGPTLSWRGIDHQGFYRLSNNLRDDFDVTGCGNSLNTANQMVEDMIIDSLSYWVTEMGIDGFRFDLATTLIRDKDHHVDLDHPWKRRIDNDPTFADIKLIAEPWDIGPYGYQVGSWGPRWSEWNDRYRDFVRSFWRNYANIRELGTRLSGSPDIYNHSNLLASRSINFVTCHDGFTMRDLVSYDIKHNEGNGENNRDGSDHNLSWNCGWEGETSDPKIIGLRRRQMKNFMATLMASTGVPMILAGDERARTQGGNNNAYCQDNQISWVDWSSEACWGEIVEATKTLISIRGEHPSLRPACFRHGQQVRNADDVELGRPDLAWFSPSGQPMTHVDWHADHAQVLGMYSSTVDDACLVWFNAADAPATVTLPGPNFGLSFTVLYDTADAVQRERNYRPGAKVTIAERCVVFFHAAVSDQPMGVDEQAEIKDGTCADCVTQ